MFHSYNISIEVSIFFLINILIVYTINVEHFTFLKLDMKSTKIIKTKKKFNGTCSFLEFFFTLSKIGVSSRNPGVKVIGAQFNLKTMFKSFPVSSDVEKKIDLFLKYQKSNCIFNTKKKFFFCVRN